VTKQTLPNPPREGRYVDHRFEDGSSGAFGLELPGEWVDVEAALRTYMNIFKWYRLTGDNGSLTRIVRRALRRRANGNELVEDPSNGAPRQRLSVLERVVRRMGAKLLPGWYDTHAMKS
jgi:hypothetical protein